MGADQHVAGTACDTKVQRNAINLASDGIHCSIIGGQINRPAAASRDRTIHDYVVGRIDRDVSSDAADRGTNEHITIGTLCLQQDIARPVGRDSQGISVTIVQGERTSSGLKFNGAVIRCDKIAQRTIRLSGRAGVSIHRLHDNLRRGINVQPICFSQVDSRRALSSEGCDLKINGIGVAVGIWIPCFRATDDTSLICNIA